MTRQSRARTIRKRPGRTAEQDLFVSLEKTADLLMGEVAELLKPSGLSVTQYNVLRILRAAAGHSGCECSRPVAAPGSEDKGLACTEIGQRLIKRDPDITRLLDRLETRGLIARQRQTRDRRVITTRITGGGLALLKAIDRPMQELHERQLEPLGARRLKQLQESLEMLRSRHSGQPTINPCDKENS